MLINKEVNDKILTLIYIWVRLFAEKRAFGAAKGMLLGCNMPLFTT